MFNQLPSDIASGNINIANNLMVPPFMQIANNMPGMPGNLPIHPDVILKRLPFYDIIGTLLRPTTLIPTTSQRVQETLFQFTLTPQQATEIATNRDIRNTAKIEHTIQVQLRFCMLETSAEQDDCFPQGIAVKVNNKNCTLPTPIPTNRPNVEPRRPPRPVNITALVKLSPTVPNSILIQWTPEFSKAFVTAIYLVRKLTSSQLLTRMKAKGIKPADYTRGLIKEKLNEDLDCEIATTMLRVSLICPLGKMRMSLPCRSSSCSHLQCFDASLFLQMNERKPTWICPVCNKPAIYDTLVIDGYFQEVLSSNNLSRDDTEIQLHKDGSWSTHVKSEKPDIEAPTKVKVDCDEIEIIDDDDNTNVKVSVIPKTNSSSPLLNNNNEPTSTTTNETVDLTNQGRGGAAVVAPATATTTSGVTAQTAVDTKELNANTATNNNEPTSTTNNDTVDLTLSDSDDDMPLRRRIKNTTNNLSTSNNSNNSNNSNASSNNVTNTNSQRNLRPRTVRKI